VRSNDYRQSSPPQAALPSIREAKQSKYDQSSRCGQPSRAGRSQPALPSIHEAEPGIYNQTFRPTQSTRSNRESKSNPIAATRYADRPQGGKTVVVRPGEPHHYGSRPDYERGEMLCTLCRCHNPDSHGDAYTMLNSPRGNDIKGRPIDWQEAKKRMLDHYGKDQISHAEELAAAPYVYDAEMARIVLNVEEDIKKSIREGYDILVNTHGNNVNWHNDDGHAKPYLTQEGAKTKFSR
jgi:hypothetical protein